MRWFWQRSPEKPLECPVCGREQKLEVISLLRGSRGQIELYFSHLPILSCGQPDHPRRFAGKDFGARLIDAVFWQKNVAMTRKGMWSKLKCFQCEKALGKEPTYQGEVGGSLKLKELPVFGIRISGPLVTCPRCGTDQLATTDEIAADVSHGFIDAFKRIDLGPG